MTVLAASTFSRACLPHATRSWPSTPPPPRVPLPASLCLTGPTDTRTRWHSHASRFLLELLKTEKPDQYKQLQAGLLTKAQQVDDEALLHNPYLQMRSVLDVKVPLAGSGSSGALPLPATGGSGGGTLTGKQ
jgi:hypothetical protein